MGPGPSVPRLRGATILDPISYAGLRLYPITCSPYVPGPGVAYFKLIISLFALSSVPILPLYIYIYIYTNMREPWF